MKKTLLVSLIAVSLSILIAGFAIPAFAHGPGDADTVPNEKEAWEACGDGDWEAMAEAMEDFHTEYFSSMPCYSTDNSGPATSAIPALNTDWGEMGGHMNGGVMRGWGGMMGSK